MPVQCQLLDTEVVVGGLTLANPVMPASGCFGPELASLMDTSALGATVTKTVFALSRPGNPAHRLTDLGHGMLNSVGIPSAGGAEFRRTTLREYQRLGSPVVVSIGGLTIEEYWDVADELSDEPVAAFEVNVSCPNLESGGRPIGVSPQAIDRIVRGVRERVSAPIFVKLTPMVTSIADVARAAEFAGASAITVANSFPGLAIDVHTRASVLGNGGGGYSGAAVKPLALRLVRDAASATDVPVIGCGGIGSARDVVEFMMAGATAVQVGTATFNRPDVMTSIVADLHSLCRELDVHRISDLVGALSRPANTTLEPQ